MEDEKKKVNLTPDESVAVLAKNSGIKEVKEGVKLDSAGKITGIKELPSNIVNEWFSELTNKLLAQEYVKQLDLSGVLAKLSPFRSSQQWKNGQLEVIASDVKATTQYAKNIVFETLFNSEDRDNEVAILIETSKPESRVKVDSSIIQRAMGSAGNFLEFIKDISGKLQQDLDYKFDTDNRAGFVETDLPALMINIEVDTSGITLAKEKYDLVNKTIINYTKKFEYPTTIFNQTGYVASTTKKNQVLMWNDDVKTEIDSELLSTTFHKELKEHGIVQQGFQFADGVYAGLVDKRFIVWDITLNETGQVNLDGFQTSFAKRMWYGIDFIPFFNNIIITETGTITPLRNALKAKMEAIVSKDSSKVEVVRAKQILARLKLVEEFEVKFKADLANSNPIKKEIKK